MSDDRPPISAPWGPPVAAPVLPPTPRHRRRWIVALAALVVAAVAVAAIVVVRGDDDASDYALLYQAGRGRMTFVLAEPNGDEIRRLTLPVGEDPDDPPRTFSAGRGHVVVTTDASTLLVPLDGGEPTEIADERLVPASNWLTDGHDALQGIILGEPPGGLLLVDLTTGAARELGDLIDDDGPFIVTGYTEDGRHALVLGGDDSWLVPLAGEGPARALNGRAVQQSLSGEQLVVVRAQDDSQQDVVLTSVADDADEEVLWSGDGPVAAVWTGEKIAVVGADHVTMLDPGNGGATEVLSAVDLEVTTVLRTSGYLVGSEGPERRWYRLDSDGGEVDELRGLEPLDARPGGRRLLFADTGEDPRVVMWTPETGSTEALDGTAAQLEVLAGGPQNNVMSSLGGRFVTAGFQPVLLADLDTGKVVDLDVEVAFAGVFSPDDRQMVVVRDESRSVSLGIVDPTDPNGELVDLGNDRGAAAWVFP